MTSYETLAKLWPEFFEKKPVKIIVTVVIGIILLVTAILLVYALMNVISSNNEKSGESVTASKEFEQQGARAPVKLVFANLVGAESVSQWFNYGKIISLLESKFEHFHYSSGIDYVTVQREFNSKRDVERYFEDIDDNLLVVSGSIQAFEDGTMFSFNFSPICQFKDLLKLGHLGVTVENNSKSLINTFMTKFVDEIIMRFNTFYIYHLSEAQEYKELVRFIKESITIYDKPCINKPSNDHISFLYSMISEAYINLNHEDSAMKYANVGYDVSPKSNYCYNYKSQGLLINFGNNIDSLRFALELINASSKSIRSGKWNRDSFVSRVYAEMCQIESNSQNFENALNYADSSIFLDSTFFKPYLLKAMILLYDCKLEGASVNISLAFNRDSTIFHSNYYLAIISALNGNFKISRIYFNNAFLIKPKEFLMEYELNFSNLEKCKFKYMDSARSFTSHVAIYK